MKYNLLGNTGVLVSEIGFGAMTFGESSENWNVFGALGDKEAQKLVDLALDQGVNFSIPPTYMQRGAPKKCWGKR
ncbi:hypothetical protein HMSSN036_07940 [Paenibacillus macerans]|nr:hypothetical protein HMSSN036_07940 [Paenibacillus macerans]